MGKIILGKVIICYKHISYIFILCQCDKHCLGEGGRISVLIVYNINRLLKFENELPKLFSKLTL